MRRRALAREEVRGFAEPAYDDGIGYPTCAPCRSVRVGRHTKGDAHLGSGACRSSGSGRLWRVRAALRSLRAAGATQSPGSFSRAAQTLRLFGRKDLGRE